MGEAKKSFFHDPYPGQAVTKAHEGKRKLMSADCWLRSRRWRMKRSWRDRSERC